jgi:hypothetical protein
VPAVTLARPPLSAPAYCHNCGSPYPWTQANLEALRDIALEAEELGAEREQLAATVGDLTLDTPKATLAATRWKRALSKAGEFAGTAARQILVEVASETAKKILFPGP